MVERSASAVRSSFLPKWASNPRMSLLAGAGPQKERTVTERSEKRWWTSYRYLDSVNHAKYLLLVADLLLSGAPNGIRTRATALKGRRPGPLDDGGRGDDHGSGWAWAQPGDRSSQTLSA
ncbi:hypothetical protein FAIPA1_10583 [Frankia sp. AiPs1]